MPDEFSTRIESFLSALRERATGGITARELAASAVEGMALAISLLDMRLLPGEGKKEEVLKLAAYCFDTYSDKCIPMLALPMWWLVKPAVRMLLLAVASGAVEPLLSLTRGKSL